MNQENADTQPIRATKSGNKKFRRFVTFLLLAIGASGIFAFGYGLGSDAEILVPARVAIWKAVDSVLTLVPSQSTLALANTSVAPSPKPTAIPLRQASVSTATVIPPTETPVPTATAIPPTKAPVPTATVIPPTETSIPTATNLPPTSTPIPTAVKTPCYREKQAWITGQMNIRENPTVNSKKVGAALAGEDFSVLDSLQGETYCWLKIDKGWMAKTALISATKPEQRIPSSAGTGVRQALATLNALVVATENRCSPYDSDSYPYSQSVEAQIVSRMGGRIYGPYTGTTFTNTRETGHRTHSGEVGSA